jgi:hypothetical protein
MSVVFNSSVAGVIGADGAVVNVEFPSTSHIAIDDADDSIKIGNGSGTYASVTNANALKVDGSAAVQPVSGTFWQATQPVSGTVTANAGTGTFTVDASGHTVPVSGTFWQATQPVSGTFWQTTQPVSIAATVNTTGATYATRLDDTTTANVTYVGKAAVGSATSSAVWQVQKIDQTTGLVITWAGSAAFNQIWDNRASLTYA